MSQHKDKFMIIDGNALLHRAWHALPQTMHTPRGTIINAAYGFMMVFLKALKEIKPSHLVVCFDAPGKTFRDTLYPKYKATREKKPQELYDQIPIIQEMIKSAGMVYFQEKGVEADDVIGTLIHKTRNRKQETVVVTGDMDVLQLVSDSVRVYTLKRGIGDTVIYAPDQVKERYQGLLPNQLVDFKALRGDPSDNIPGARGIGLKSATDLLNTFGSVEKLYLALQKNTPEKLAKKTGIRVSVFEKVKESKKIVRLSQKLATIKQTVPLNYDFSDFALSSFNPKNLATTFQKYAFRRIMPQIQHIADMYEIDMKTGQAGDVERGQETSPYVFLETKEAVVDFVKEAEKQKEIAIDTETDSLDTLSTRLVGLSFSWDKGVAYYLEARHLKLVTHLLEDVRIKKVGHNIKFDWKVLQRAGVKLNNIYFDTMIAAYVLNPGLRNYSLDTQVFQHFNVSMQKIEELIGPRGKQGQLSMDKVPSERVAHYAAEDADYTWQLYQKLKADLNAEKRLQEVFYDIEMPLVPLLGHMECLGISLDQKMLAALGKKVDKLLGQTEQKICSIAGEKFNIGSPKQLKEILFEKLLISTRGIRKTKTGISTAARELEKLRGRHRIIDHIFKYRELAKLQSTYIRALPRLVHAKTHRVHTHFNQVIAATGRLSSTEPNMQNIPIRTSLGREIRGAFVADQSKLLLSLDYSQIELRIAAHLSKDKELIQAFNAGKDIHTTTAAKLFNKAENKVTSEQRRHAKEANFGVLYGLGPRGLAERLDIRYEEAVDFIERYKALYRGVFAYLQEVIETTKKRGYAETFFGRRRYIPEINSSAPGVRAGAERAAFNMPFQGTAADIMKMAMINIDSKLKQEKEKKKPEIALLLQVHDELVFEVYKSVAKKWARVMAHEMETVVKLGVPLKVDAKVGKNWKEMEEV